MARFGDRVKETTDTTGTGTLDLNGAVVGFQAFIDEFISGQDNISYVIVDDVDDPTQWEVGYGTLTNGTPDTLSRDTVVASSNAGNKVSWSAGTKVVIATPNSADLEEIFTENGWGTKLASVRSITGSTAMVAADNGKLILANASGESPPVLTYTLLSAATAGSGFVVTVKNIGASGTVYVQSANSPSDGIDGSDFVALTSQYQAITLRCDGATWRKTDSLAFSSIGAGLSLAAGVLSALVKQVRSSAITAGTTTLQIPADNSTPAQAEGTQIATDSITPADNSNKVLILAAVSVDVASATPVTISLFRGTTCIHAQSIETGGPGVISFAYLDSPASASAQTYSLRIGNNDASTTVYFGQMSGYTLNGVMNSQMILAEIEA